MLIFLMFIILIMNFALLQYLQMYSKQDSHFHTGR